MAGAASEVGVTIAHFVIQCPDTVCVRACVCVVTGLRKVCSLYDSMTAA